ncbi:hypothetical protein LCGC14_0540130 [marine sediment metagenome]|uniref:Uncharacterized protein n=1 Tax=marine sediment metagenome TaxID=412755 RepID=A0A0F9UEE8_9ZZZZ
MRLSAGIKEEDKDKGIEIILSILKDHVNDLFNKVSGEEVHLIFVKDENYVLYSLSEGMYAKQIKIVINNTLKKFRKELIKQQEEIIIKQYDKMIKNIDSIL